jgi:threonine dehydrogenase-like Zn-dependent dehydrogenase
MKKVAINGFGRIGRLFFRQAFENKEIDIVAINDLGDIENLAYLLRHDTVYRTYDKTVSFEGQNLIVDGKKIVVLQEKDPAKLPWGAMGIDVVVECTGFFESFEKASVHVTGAGAKHVVISAPAKDDEGIAGEIERTIEFYEGTLHYTNHIERIILCGGGSNLQGLVPYMTRRLGRLIEAGDPWAAMQLGGTLPVIPREQSISYSTAIGLALKAQHIYEDIS